MGVGPEKENATSIISAKMSKKEKNTDEFGIKWSLEKKTNSH